MRCTAGFEDDFTAPPSLKALLYCLPFSLIISPSLCNVQSGIASLFWIPVHIFFSEQRAYPCTLLISMSLACRIASKRNGAVLCQLCISCNTQGERKQRGKEIIMLGFRTWYREEYHTNKNISKQKMLKGFTDKDMKENNNK